MEPEKKNNEEVTWKSKQTWVMLGGILIVIVLLFKGCGAYMDYANESYEEDMKVQKQVEAKEKAAAAAEKKAMQHATEKTVTKAIKKAKDYSEEVSGADKKTKTIKEVFVNEVEKNKKFVRIELNSKEQLGGKLTVFNNNEQTLAILKEMRQMKDVGEIYFVYHLPLIDQYGNKESDVVMQVKFDKSDVDKMNFDNLYPENVEGLATYYSVHPALKE